MTSDHPTFSSPRFFFAGLSGGRPLKMCFSIVALNQAGTRNPEGFAAHFMFQLNAEEDKALRSQIATLKTGRGQHRKYRPYVFIEHGAIMEAARMQRGGGR